MKKPLEVTRQDFQKFHISSWEEFEKSSSIISKRSIIEAIQFFFSKDCCDAEQVFVLLNKHPEGNKIWNDMHYLGGIDEAYLVKTICLSFKKQFAHNDEKLDLWSSYINGPTLTKFE